MADSRDEAPYLNAATGISNVGRGDIERAKQKKLIENPQLKRFLVQRNKKLFLQNMIKRKNMQNQMQRMRLQKQFNQLKTKKMFVQAMSIPITRKPMFNDYPAYATPEIIGDIDSAFNADINHSDSSLWGSENYYNEKFYNEDFYGGEFDTDPFFHLQIKPRDDLSPLFW